MIQSISIQPYQIQGHTNITIDSPKAMKGFPLMTVDTDTYIVGAEIQSGIDFEPEAGRHCIAIGKGCSLAEAITFMVDLDHDHASVVQGVISCLKNSRARHRKRRRGSIILQNDVWVGHGATIMAGVTLHNGCVVAANAMVTKDVPPYAIVGGNPARILGYRFDEETISALQQIAWWDWPKEVQMARKNDLELPVQDFVEKYHPHANVDDREGYPSLSHTKKKRRIVLFMADMNEPFPLYPKVLQQYFEKDRPHTELLIYLSKEDSGPKDVQAIEQILQKYSDRDSYVTLQTGETLDEDMLFQGADHFVTTRCRQTVHRTCLADRYQVKLLYGTDEPIFPPELD